MKFDLWAVILIHILPYRFQELSLILKPTQLTKPPLVDIGLPGIMFQNLKSNLPSIEDLEKELQDVNSSD